MAHADNNDKINPFFSCSRSAECYPELFKLYSQSQQTSASNSYNSNKLFFQSTLLPKAHETPVKKRGRPRKHPLLVDQDKCPKVSDWQNPGSCLHVGYANCAEISTLGGGKCDNSPNVNTPSSASAASSVTSGEICNGLQEGVKRNYQRRTSTPKIPKPTPRSVVNIHAMLMDALCSYTIKRAHIPREIKELTRKKRPCVADMTAILGYQEQMNILLRSEYYFLQKIEEEYGSVTPCYDNSVGIPLHSTSNSALELDSLIVASEKALREFPVET
ncbi:uncharacterized protein LOC129586830 isoform X2 [Paramacrobiotus metropolitanus]|uniref:uncharacterized protein LOC129586830 isoform X2 n=1 Tax=Paramacrobiotus metropolitanus TaxID=2943436 RepID=UPI002445D1DB|nr:uncharacterized protein LOC129586830 isoform X2 [Paramacrobiotus metropolitanus]